MTPRTAPWPARLRPGRGGAALLATTLLLAIVAALAVATWTLRAPLSDVGLLAVFLTASGSLSLLVGVGVFGWIARRIPGLRLRLALAYGIGLLVALANVLATSALMFLSAHDLALLVVLLAFAGVISYAFAHTTAAALTTGLEELASAAGRLAEGDLNARVHMRESDEIGRVGVAFDQMAARLQEAFVREQATQASRRDLLAAISHDLRTPLATTRAMIEAMADGVVIEPADTQRYLALARGEIQHMSNLITDLFDLSQIESGTLETRPVPVALGQLVAETVSGYEAQAVAKGVSLATACAKGAERAIVLVDPRQMQRVLRNLLDNALRHTPSGGTVRVDVEERDALLHVCISDSGVGVPPEERERIFERYFRGDSARRRGDSDGGGAGLGLAIARGLVLAHQGRIWTEQSPLGGASFHVSLTLAAPG